MLDCRPFIIAGFNAHDLIPKVLATTTEHKMHGRYPLMNTWDCAQTNLQILGVLHKSGNDEFLGLSRKVVETPPLQDLSEDSERFAIDVFPSPQGLVRSHHPRSQRELYWAKLAWTNALGVTYRPLFWIFSSLGCSKREKADTRPCRSLEIILPRILFQLWHYCSGLMGIITVFKCVVENREGKDLVVEMMRTAAGFGLNVVRVYAHSTDKDHPFLVSLFSCL